MGTPSLLLGVAGGWVVSSRHGFERDRGRRAGGAAAGRGGGPVLRRERTGLAVAAFVQARVGDSWRVCTRWRDALSGGGSRGCEELGITPPLGSLLAVDWAPHPDEGDKVLFVFDGGLLGREYVERVRPDPVEVSGYAFRSVAEFEELLIPRLARRVLAAVLARAAGETVYLEDGEARRRDGTGS